jgi:glyoxylase-like metal-dependent hydrolase (beta-lactamase superfamily II)
VRELRNGVWHWQAPHPDWKPEEEWDQMVSSYAIDDGERVLLFDPLALPREIDALLDGRETAVVLTCPWHARDAESIAERLGVSIHVPPPDEGDPSPLEGHVFAAGDRLPIGVEAFPGMEPNDLVLLVESRGAVIAGDTLIDRGEGLEIPANWLREGVTREQVAEGLCPLLERPVEHVLPTHGEPTDRSALERALS